MHPSHSFVAYLRVSTARQGATGLGIEAQREAVRRYLGDANGLLAEYVEVETGKGADALSRRPQLRDAMNRCRREGAVLLIAKLDRLSRNLRFITELMESKVRFVACDCPEATELTLHILGAFAEHEAKRIGERTREALARAKARGVRLGRCGWENLTKGIAQRQAAAAVFAERLRGQVEGFRLRGLTQRQMVAELNGLGIRAPKGGNWSLPQLQRVVRRLSAPPGAEESRGKIAP